MKLRKVTTHFEGGRDKQRQECYKCKCLRCGSKRHSLATCFMKGFGNRTGWCHACSLRNHANVDIHVYREYGNNKCCNQNAMRLLTCVFEDETVRPMLEEQFPDVRKFTNNEELLQWLRTTDEKGHTWYSGVLEIVHSVVIRI